MEQQERFAGVRLPDPGFAGDDGSADPALAGALAEHAAGALSSHDVVAALAGARLLVPVVAVLDEAEVGADGLRRDKDSHMATVSLLNPDGRRGLLAFTSTATLAAWQSDARPVAATSQRVAQAALQEGADAVLLDVAGPVPFPVEGDSAAARWPTGTAWPAPHRDPQVVEAVRALAWNGRLPLDLRDGAEHGCDLLVLLASTPQAPEERVVRDLADRLGADPMLAQRCPRGVAVTVA